MTHVHAFRMTMIGILGAALIATGLLATAPPAGAFTKGSFYKAQLAAERNKCKKVKSKAKKRTCQKGVARKAAAATNRAMSGTLGLYGHRLKQSQIPATNGTLIWSKRLPTNEGAARTDFVLYSSKSYPGNRRIAVSGTVSIPDGAPPTGGWPLISWAHGTTGIADQCAPSLGGDQGSYGGAEPLIENWLEQGYAVVATDYEGLGTKGVHPYLIGESEGRGVVDIVKAGRQLDPRIANQMVIAGHSQGGHAALFAAELAPTWGRGINHLGTVPYAPPADFQLQGAGIGALPADAYGISALAATILRGAEAGDPSIDPEAILTPEAFALYPKTETVCLGELTTEFEAADVGPGDLLRTNVLFQPEGAAFLAVLGEMDPLITTNRPMLILQGRQDTTVQPGLTDTLAERLEELNPGLVTYMVFGNAGTVDVPTGTPSTHGSILIDSLTEANQFLADRFGRGS